MPRKRTGMKKIHEIMRLHDECKMSIRQIAKAVNVSRPVVSETISRLKISDLSYRDIKEISDSDLTAQLSSKQESHNKAERLLDNFPGYAK